MRFMRAIFVCWGIVASMAAQSANATDYGPYYCYGCGPLVNENGSLNGSGVGEALVRITSDWLGVRLTHYPNAPAGIYTGDRYIVCDGNKCIYMRKNSTASDDWLPIVKGSDTGGYKNPSQVAEYQGGDGCKLAAGTPVYYGGIITGYWAYVTVSGSTTKEFIPTSGGSGSDFEMIQTMSYC